MDQRKMRLLATSAVLVCLSSPFAVAQDTSAEAGDPQAASESAENAQPAETNRRLGTVTVTARKTEESLQSTPVAVTAQSGDDLLKAQVTQVDQLQYTVPGLIIQPATAQPGSAAFSLRGQSSPDGLIAIDQAVGSYFDGVYVARSSGGLFNLVDIERVEVLRGPQGTLFGRNTTGGAVNVMSQRPTGDFEGMIRSRVGNYNAREITSVLNVPIKGDEIALRGVFQHSKRDGYGHNATFDEEVGSDEVHFFRGTALFAPDEAPWELSIRADYTDRETGGELIGLKSFTETPTNQALIALCNGNIQFAPVEQGGGPNGLVQLQPQCPFQGPPDETLANYALENGGTGDFYTVYNSMSGIYGNAETGGVSATFDLELAENLDFKSITAWRGISTESLSDNDGTPYAFTGGISREDGNFIEQTQWSQEVQLTGDALDDRLNFILGAFYFTESGKDRSKSYAVFPLSAALSYVDATVENKSYALFGQATYKITDTINFTGGLRYTEDDRYIRRRNRNETPGNSGNFTCAMDAASLDEPGICRATNELTFDYISYTAGFDWQASENVFLYAKTSRGHRSGGFNTRAVTAGPSLSFEPEEVTDYEVGAKLDMLSNTLRLNLAAFLTDYQNVQRNVPVVTPGANTLTSGNQNAATAEIRGLEAELIWAPTDNLTLGASGTLMDPEYTEFSIPVGVDEAGDPIVVDVSDTPFLYAPKESFTLSADYDVPLDRKRLNFHVDYAYRSDTYGVGPLVGEGLFGGANPDTNKIDAYGILNGQISLTFDDPSVELAFYARNILEKEYIQRILALEDTPLGISSYLPGDPRTYGVSLTWNF